MFDDNDHSDLKFIKKIQKSDKRIKLIVNNKQLGAGFSRNRGIKYSRSNYVAFIDADDLWKKNKIELQLKFMIKNRLLISHTSYEILKKIKKIKRYSELKVILIISNFFSLVILDCLLLC